MEEFQTNGISLLFSFYPPQEKKKNNPSAGIIHFVLHLVFQGMAALRRKVTIVGDNHWVRCASSLCWEQLPKSCKPSLFDTYATDTEVDGKEMELILFDVAGKNEFSYGNLHSVFYKDTDVILMCFSVDRPDSQQNILDFGVPEIKLFCLAVPIILVATKTEL